MTLFLANGLNLIPWLFSGILLLGGAFLAWRVGMPAVKIAALEQHIKLIELQQKTAIERAELAEARSTRLGEQLAGATEALKEANMRIASLLTVIELKGDWEKRRHDDVHLPPGTTQTVTTKVEATKP